MIFLTSSSLTSKDMSEQQKDVSGAVTEHDPTRAYFTTEKEHEEKVQQCINARRGKLRQLTAKSNFIDSHMVSDVYVDNIEQSEMEHYKRLVEEFKEANYTVLQYLPEEDKEADQENWFEPKLQCCQDFIHSTYKWIEDTKLHMELSQTSVKDVGPNDSVSNVSEGKRRTNRPSSEAGSRHSGASSTASARLREEANRAALLARSAALT